MPAAKAAGDKLIGGTVNGTGSLVMRADKVGSDTMLSRIVTMVAEAHAAAQPFSALPIPLRATLCRRCLPSRSLPLLRGRSGGPTHALAYGLIASVSVLIIACPCALGLATPMTIGVAVGKGAGAGVLIKSAEALERMEKVNVLVVDKTGTLTEGRPKVTAVVPAGNMSELDILSLRALIDPTAKRLLSAR